MGALPIFFSFFFFFSFLFFVRAFSRPLFLVCAGWPLGAFAPRACVFGAALKVRGSDALVSAVASRLKLGQRVTRNRQLENLAAAKLDWQLR